MKLKKMSFLAIILLLCTTSSCKKDEEKLIVNVRHEIHLPAPLLEIADGYVTYIDREGERTEKLIDGKFEKTSNFKWIDEELEESENYFSSLKLTLKLKVPESSLKEGVKLLLDPNAFYSFTYNESYSHDKENNWIGSSSSSSTTITNGKKYLHSKEQQEYEYSIQNQIDFFNNQENSPLYQINFNRLGQSVVAEATFFLGQDHE